MTKWKILFESDVELSGKTTDIIEGFFKEGIGNGTVYELAILDSHEEALEYLKKYKCTSRVFYSHNVKFLEADFYYAEEIDEEGEEIGNFEFADVL